MTTARTIILSALAALSACGGASLIRAADSAELVPALPPLETRQRVEASRSVRVGRDTLLYKRVSPPAAAKLATSESEAPSFQPVALDPAVFEAERRFLLCSITPYRPLGVTELQWNGDDGHPKRVFVHDDLTYIGGSFHLQLDGRYFDYCTIGYGGYDDATLYGLPPDIRRGIVATRSLPLAEFVQIPSATGSRHPLTPEEIDQIDVMLAHYQINRAELRRAHEAALAQARIDAEAKRIRDLTPKTYELRFWPVASQRYSTSSR